MFLTIRKTLRTVKYLPVREAIGMQILVSDSRTAASEVTKFLHSQFAGLVSARVDESGAATLIKYGILDLSFTLSDVIETRRLTLSDLRELGLYPPKEERVDEKNDFFQLEEVYEHICEEAEENENVLKALFFLTSDALRPSAGISGEKSSVASLNDFPQILTVIDSCITNAESIWLLKHFYM